MIKIIQDVVSKNFVVSVYQFEKMTKTYKIANRIARVLAKHGVVSKPISPKDGVVVVELVTFDDSVSLDNVLWTLVDDFNVGHGFWDYLGIYIESCYNGMLIQTNKDGVMIKMHHKNAHKLSKDDNFAFTFVGGLQYFEVFKDRIHIDFTGSHKSALQVAQDLLNLLDSLD